MSKLCVIRCKMSLFGEFLLVRDAMGKFSAKGNDAIYQWIPEALKGERCRGAPVYFDGRLFAGSVNDTMVEFRFSQARILRS